MKNTVTDRQLLAYMEEKYQEEFQYPEPYAGQLGKDYTMISAVSRTYPERRVLIRFSVRNGQPIFEDNYLAYLLKDEMEAKIRKSAQECFGSCTVRYKIPDFVFPSDFTTASDAEALLTDVRAMPQFYIHVEEEKEDKKENRQRKAELFWQKNAANHYCIKAVIHFEKAEETLVFPMDELGKLRYLRWLPAKGGSG